MPQQAAKKVKITARFIESIKNRRWWDAERAEIETDKNGKKFASFYLTQATADGTIRRIRRIHILKDGKPVLKRRIGATNVCRHDSFMVTMPISGGKQWIYR